MKFEVRIDADASNPQAVNAAIEYAVSTLERRAEQNSLALDWSLIDVWARRPLRGGGDLLVTVKAPVLKG